MKMPIELLVKLESHTKLEPANLVEEITLEVDKKVCFDTTLNNVIKEELVNILKCKIITFAWHLEEVLPELNYPPLEKLAFTLWFQQ